MAIWRRRSRLGRRELAAPGAPAGGSADPHANGNERADSLAPPIGGVATYDAVDQASFDSFPASDAPSWWAG